MTRLIIFLTAITFLFSTSKTWGQSKLIVFTENDEYFSASLEKDFSTEKVNNFFIRDNIVAQEQIINITVENKSFGKLLKLESESQNIYELISENGEYKLRYRGAYKLNESLDFFNFSQGQEASSSQKTLIPLNDIIESIENSGTGQIDINQISRRLNSGYYNCRQLKELFSRITSDAEKLRIFELTNHNCFDPQNIESALEETGDISIKNKIREIALKNFNQF